MRSIHLLSVLAILAACSPAHDDAGAFGDLALINANVYTADADNPSARAVVVRDDSIIFVGSVQDALAFVGEESDVRDLGGKLVLPGFIDTHAHPITAGGYATALSLETWGTVDEWIAAIKDYAVSNPGQGVLFGYGFLASTFGPTGPTRQQIDAVVPDRPVLIMDEGLHGAWVNTAALRALNITQDTADPVPGYSYYKRDANGDATGYLLEGTANMAMQALNVINEDVIFEGTGIIFDLMNEYGVTAVFDAGVIGNTEGVGQILRRLEDSGHLTVRLVGSRRAETQEDFAGAVDAADRWRTELKGRNYHYNTLKIANDGTVEGRTAAMFEDYQGEPGNSGETVFSEAQVTTMMTDAASRDIDVHVHALGERAIHESLNAIEAAKKSHPDSATRYTICHVQVITDQDLPRFAELGVIAQSTPLWASYDIYGEQFVSQDQFRRFWRYKSLEESGAMLTFGSDFPASGAGTLGLSPVIQIEMGHTRQEFGQPEAPIQPRASERLSVESLVRGFTIDAAYQLHLEDQIGSIEVGKKADLVVLDQNIFEIDPYSIHQTEVLMTVMDGNIVFER
jgi:predicted amidohydrolase YtcJ